ncbi:MAG: WhiB family transcriptional regulator [Pseudonocardia sp.]|uniref:WhiB family transcriptional regulator n=1 Tax=unclassified Pseudonocardia TaxID=2619320 RepID=UPI0008690646|nr:MULTISPECIES: WhiB family transcriptional regulator [unclassified Pseudonocardia]MBN9109614.1 WhiB family transcriptional regulator [Pseudonocardia sp.]ODU24659.1 MAG: hypothetical protein ABS80_11830 [Pseudonocardia sp. SCN 72-51]ODU99081.1 MAG: hypothetical protein ABT15_32495 [Pseudonocardia sp. SCN 73-27]
MTGPDRDGWRDRAACARPGVDPEAFYPLDLDPGGPAVMAARRVCGACPVRALCLLDVMASEDPARRWGVIAGLTPDERTDLHRDQLIPLPGVGVAA